MITSIRSRGWTGKVLVGMMVLQRQDRFYTARCDRMSRCSSRRCSWRTLRAWCQPCRTCGVYLDVSCSLKKRYQGCWSQMLSLLWWYVWYLWKNVRICLICQGSSVIYSRQGALWAQICEIADSASAEYCSTFLCLSVSQSVCVSQTWHLIIPPLFKVLDHTNHIFSER